MSDTFAKAAGDISGDFVYAVVVVAELRRGEQVGAELLVLLAVEVGVHRLEDLLEGGDADRLPGKVARAEARPGIEFSQRGQGQRVGTPGPVGRPVHRFVVEHEDRTVRAALEVELEAAGAVFVALGEVTNIDVRLQLEAVEAEVVEVAAAMAALQVAMSLPWSSCAAKATASNMSAGNAIAVFIPARFPRCGG